jgi:dephospho-CoA kinase
MVIVGLTGSIGMGKSTAARMLRRMRAPVHDSDAAVHRLLAPGGAAVGPIDAAFPGVVRDGAVDRGTLGQRVFGDRAALARLEGILHPRVRADIDTFLRRTARQRRPVAVLDVPLLLEGDLWTWCDLIAVVSAPPVVQRQRVLARPGMTAERFRGILARQMPDAVKRRRADAVVPSGLGLAVTWQALADLVARARAMPPRRWPPDPYRRRMDARNRSRYRNHRA